MLRSGSARSAVVFCAFVLVACDGRSSVVDTPPSEAVVYRISAPVGAVGAASDEPGTIGNFRVKPGPGTDGVIRITVGQGVIVNGNDYRPSYPGTTLYLIANWGDGTGNQRVGCGPCRATHVYDAPGSFKLEMTIDDGIVPPAVRAASPITEVVTVIVEGVSEPRPPLVGNPPVAGPPSGFVSCPSGGFSVTMNVTDADGDAFSWNFTLTGGGTFTSASTGGPVPSGTSVNVTGKIAGSATNVLRLDVIDVRGRPSVPVSKIGVLGIPGCGPGTTLEIFG